MSSLRRTIVLSMNWIKTLISYNLLSWASDLSYSLSIPLFRGGRIIARVRQIPSEPHKLAILYLSYSPIITVSKIQSSRVTYQWLRVPFQTVAFVSSYGVYLSGEGEKNTTTITTTQRRGASNQITDPERVVGRDIKKNILRLFFDY